MATAQFETAEYVSGPAGKGKVSKITRYGWILRDRPGEFMLIDKHELKVDHAYQRDKVVINKVRDIQANWSWAGCGCILVAMRPDGSFWVFDGQHRVLAARNRADISELPCLVFECDDVTQEAAGFLVCNGERKPVTAAAKFKALVLTGDKAAVAVQEIFDRLGVTLVEQPARAGEIKCIAKCLYLAESDRGLFERCLEAAVELCGESPVTKDILEGLSWIHRKHGLLSDPRFIRRLCSVSVAEIMTSIAKFAAAEGKRGERVCGTAILKLVNKGLRNKFVDEGDE
jgi:hypothetical protein